ncbi:MAG: ROK family protein [Acidimicrobiales bacterium]|nr:ROK family protein [Acidimicrobiales bacterium]
MTAEAHTVGFDIGGTNIRAVRTAHDGTVVGEVRSRRRPHGADELVTSIVDFVTELDDAAPEPIAAVGIGIAGLITRDGTVRTSPNIPSLVEFPLGARLADRLGVPVRIDNDANVAALAELNARADSIEDLLFVASGTGIGGGVVIDRTLVRGWQGFAAEIGHMTILPDGPVCACGRAGCWEALASGTALGRLGREAAAAGRAPELVALAGGVDAIRGEHVTELAASDDADAARVLDEWAGWLAVGIANLVALLDPEVVVLGGGLSESGSVVLPRVRRAVEARLFGAAHRQAPGLELSVHADSAGVIGAAILARDAR